MAALQVDGKEPVKHALLVICCRADRYTGMARVSIGRVAKDMGCTYNTAKTALEGLVKTGYLTVDKSAGLAHLWMLTSSTGDEVPHQSTTGTSSTDDEGVINWHRGKESLEKPKERGAGRSPSTATGTAGEKPSPAPRPTDFAPGSGILDDGRSSRRRQVTADN